MLILFFLFSSGCAIINKENEINKNEERNKAKEAQLSELKSNQEELMKKRAELLYVLRNNEFTEKNLLQQLDDIIKVNSLIEADNETMQIEKLKIDNRLRQYRDEIIHVQNDDQTTVAEKKAKINNLKRKIKTYVMFGIK